jgi:hypothetical protein
VKDLRQLRVRPRPALPVLAPVQAADSVAVAAASAALDRKRSRRS